MNAAIDRRDKNKAGFSYSVIAEPIAG